MVRARQFFIAVLLGCLCLPLAPSASGQARIMPIPRPIPVPPEYDPPRPPSGYTYRWVPPVYRTVYDRVWVEETTSRVCQWVQIDPGPPARWQQIWTTVTIPAHWETTTRRELVSPGYWELVPLHVFPPRPIPLPSPTLSNPPTVGVDGYSRQGGEDLSKFSPLSEWPDK